MKTLLLGLICLTTLNSYAQNFEPKVIEVTYEQGETGEIKKCILNSGESTRSRIDRSFYSFAFTNGYDHIKLFTKDSSGASSRLQLQTPVYPVKIFLPIINNPLRFHEFVIRLAKPEELTSLDKCPRHDEYFFTEQE